MRKIFDTGPMVKILREPLLHFLLLGGLLFILYDLLNPGGKNPQSATIQIEDADVDRLISQYQQNWSVPPDSATVFHLIEEEIRSEIYYREGLRMGLDQNDEIVKRRLTQKYEFLIKDLAPPPLPQPKDLEAYYRENRDQYLTPKRISFFHFYFSPDRRSDPLADARGQLPTVLDKKPDSASLLPIGDAFHLPDRYVQKRFDEVRNTFGLAFAQALFENSNTGWITTPVQSGYGFHLVYLSSVGKEQYLSLEEATERIRSDWQNTRLAQQNQEWYENLRKQYRIQYNLNKWAKIVRE